MSKWIGWHFLPVSGRTRYSDEAVVVGQTLTCNGDLELCENGLHASTRAIDALYYAPGPIACRVELLGERMDGNDKSCARSRRVISMIDATTILHEFACWCAGNALMAERDAGREPDPRSWAAIEAKRAWLRGEITDSDLDAARAATGAAEAERAAAAAARAAAWAAERAAAWAAERAAARAATGAAEAAAWAAERAAAAAARAAAWAAERAAESAAERAAARAATGAAEAAAWAAERAAERATQNAQLERMLLAAMGEEAGDES